MNSQPASVQELVAIGQQLKEIQELNIALQARLGPVIDVLIDINDKLSANEDSLLDLHRQINDIASRILPGDWRAMAKGGRE